MKERLVGAVVLVGLIVALVPEMLSGPRRESDAGQAADDSVRTYTIDLDPASGLPADTPATPGVAEGPSLAPAEAVPARPEPEVTQPATASTEERPATPKPPPREAQREAPREAPQPAVDAGWVVQLGSFASRDNAERLAAEVRRGGYRAFVSRFESGRSVRYRVRVGPERERAQAEAVAKRLQRDGRQVSIVAHP